VFVLTKVPIYLSGYYLILSVKRHHSFEKQNVLLSAGAEEGDSIQNPLKLGDWL